MDRDTAQLLLQQWGDWSRDDDPDLWFRPAAGSVEGRYLAEAGDVMVEDRAPRRDTINDDQAKRIDGAVMSCGRTYALLLVMLFVRRINAELACRRLCLPGDPRLLSDAAVRKFGDIYSRHTR